MFSWSPFVLYGPTLHPTQSGCASDAALQSCTQWSCNFFPGWEVRSEGGMKAWLGIFPVLYPTEQSQNHLRFRPAKHWSEETLHLHKIQHSWPWYMHFYNHKHCISVFCKLNFPLYPKKVHTHNHAYIFHIFIYENVYVLCPGDSLKATGYPCLKLNRS